MGADRVAGLLVNLTARGLEADDEVDWIRVNGQAGLYVVRNGEPNLLSVVSWRAGKVAELLVIVNPAKLARLHERWLARVGFEAPE